MVEGNYIFFHDRRSVFSQWARLGFRVGVNYFSSAEKLFMHEKALFAGDLLKAREIMGEDRPWELRRLGREVRWLNEGVEEEGLLLWYIKGIGLNSYKMKGQGGSYLREGGRF